MRSVAFCITIMVLSESLLEIARQGTPEEFRAGSICLNTFHVPGACYSVGSPWRYMGFSCRLLLSYGQQWNCARPQEACLYNSHFPCQDLSCKYKWLWSLLWRCPRPSWMPPGVTYCGVPALAAGLGSMISWGPFQTLQFCDSGMHTVLPQWKNRTICTFHTSTSFFTYMTPSLSTFLLSSFLLAFCLSLLLSSPFIPSFFLSFI